MKTLGITLATLFCAGVIIAQTPARPSNAPAPQQQSPKPAEQGTLRVSSTLVNNVFTVADRNGKGKFVTNLKQEDFRIYEDDKLQTIAKFDKETNLPLSMALLVDTSGSIRDKLVLEQEAAISFFYDNLHRGKDRGVVISFDSGVDLLTPTFWMIRKGLPRRCAISRPVAERLFMTRCISRSAAMLIFQAWRRSRTIGARC